MNVEQREIIELQRRMLEHSLGSRLERLARRCAPVWEEKVVLDRVLARWLDRIPYCRLVYAMDARGVQISANVFVDSLQHEMLGQDLSRRPYFQDGLAQHGFALSQVYISSVTRRPCLTAVQAVSRHEGTLGWVAADFELRDLPLLQATCRPDRGRQAINGDPVIRNVFQAQQRVESPMDRHMDDVVAIVEELVCERGVFHAKLHFSGSRATLWLLDDPYHYRIHLMDEILDPSLCLAYRRRPYPARPAVGPAQVRAVLTGLARLRLGDERYYLRSGSLNVMNGLVGLTFSSDGSQYLTAEAFLEADLDTRGAAGPGEAVAG
jgi:hypothetical protein